MLINKQMPSAVLYTVFCYAMVFIASCSGTDDSAGTGSQAGNARVAVLINGVPAESAAVFIRLADELADTAAGFDTIPDIFADTYGIINLDSLEGASSGEYIIEVVSRDCDTLAAVFTATTDVSDDIILSVDTVCLTPTASISGSVDTLGLKGGECIWVRIPGIARTVRVDSVGMFQIPRVPAGNWPLRILTGDPRHGNLPPDTLGLRPGEAFDAGSIRLCDQLWRDTVLVRNLLRINGLSTPLDSVVVRDPVGRIMELNLSGAAIAIIPPFIGELRLRALRITGTSMDTLPMQVGFMRLLKVLDIHGNKLGGLPPTLGALVQLDSLDISDNLITGVPAELATQRPGMGLFELSYLSVDGNRFALPVPQQMTDWINRFSINPAWLETQNP